MDTAIIVCLISALANVAVASVSIINGRLSRHDSEKDKRQEQDDLVKKGVIVMLHDRLYQACRFYLQQGSIDQDGYDNVTELHTAYHNLGGNHTGDKLYQMVEELYAKSLQSIGGKDE